MPQRFRCGTFIEEEFLRNPDVFCQFWPQLEPLVTLEQHTPGTAGGLGAHRPGRCFTLKDLAVNGRDVLAAGIAPGPEVGRVLEGLLEQVLSGAVQNERGALLDLIARL